MEQSTPIKLGSKVKDKITGFQGTAVARCEYLDSSPTIQVQKSLSGDKITNEWIAESRLEVTD